MIPHIQWTGRESSASEHINFLYQKDNIFITDNHRLTPWILCRQLTPNAEYNYLHIDAHEDAKSGLIEKLPLNWQHMSLEEFKNHQDREFNCALFRWDNYLPLIFSHFNFRKRIGATHLIGEKGNFTHRLTSDQLYRGINNLCNDELKWVINIDLDYFYARDYKCAPYLSKEYIQECFNRIFQYQQQEELACILVALSPECCGGWKQAEDLLHHFCESFKLPHLEPTGKFS